MFCFLDLSSTAVRPFVISFAKKGKGRFCNKYAVLKVRWYEFVRQVLGSQEVNEIFTGMSFLGKDVV